MATVPAASARALLAYLVFVVSSNQQQRSGLGSSTGWGRGRTSAVFLHHAAFAKRGHTAAQPATHP